MSEIQYFYLDGRVRDGNYDELTVMEQDGKKKWNQAALRRIAEPQRPSKIVCRCREEDKVEILMHVVEKPVRSGKYYLATNPKQSGRHAKGCSKRRMEESILVVPSAETESAIQHVQNVDGKTTVHIENNPFRGGLRERKETDALNEERNTLYAHQLLSRISTILGRVPWSFGSLLQRSVKSTALNTLLAWIHDVYSLGW